MLSGINGYFLIHPLSSLTQNDNSNTESMLKLNLTENLHLFMEQV